MKHLKTIAGAALGISLLASSAGAADTLSPQAEEVLQHVKTADLDLASEKGLGKLQRRLNKAIAKACAPSGANYSAVKERNCVVELRRELTPQQVAALQRNDDQG